MPRNIFDEVAFNIFDEVEQLDATQPTPLQRTLTQAGETFAEEGSRIGRGIQRMAGAIPGALQQGFTQPALIGLAGAQQLAAGQSDEGLPTEGLPGMVAGAGEALYGGLMITEPFRDPIRDFGRILSATGLAPPGMIRNLIAKGTPWDAEALSQLPEQLGSILPSKESVDVGGFHNITGDIGGEIVSGVVGGYAGLIRRPIKALSKSLTPEQVVTMKTFDTLDVLEDFERTATLRNSTPQQREMLALPPAPENLVLPPSTMRGQPQMRERYDRLVDARKALETELVEIGEAGRELEGLVFVDEGVKRVREAQRKLMALPPDAPGNVRAAYASAVQRNFNRVQKEMLEAFPEHRDLWAHTKKEEKLQKLLWTFINARSTTTIAKQQKVVELIEIEKVFKERLKEVMVLEMPSLPVVRPPAGVAQTATPGPTPSERLVAHEAPRTNFGLSRLDKDFVITASTHPIIGTQVRAAQQKITRQAGGYEVGGKLYSTLEEAQKRTKLVSTKSVVDKTKPSPIAVLTRFGEDGWQVRDLADKPLSRVFKDRSKAFDWARQHFSEPSYLPSRNIFKDEFIAMPDGGLARRSGAAKRIREEYKQRQIKNWDAETAALESPDLPNRLALWEQKRQQGVMKPSVPLDEAAVLEQLSPNTKAAIRTIIEKNEIPPDFVQQVLGKSFPTSRGEAKSLVNKWLEVSSPKSGNTIHSMDELMWEYNNWKPQNAIEKALFGMSPTIGGSLMTLHRNMLAGGSWVVRQFGEAGTQLAKFADEVRTFSTKRTAGAIEDVNKIVGNAYGKLPISPWAKREYKRKVEQQIVDLLDGKLTSGHVPERINNAANSIRKMLVEVGQEARDRGIRVAGPDGKKVPFELVEDYFPRLIKENILKDGKEFRRAIAYVKNRYQTQDEAEAAALIRKWIEGNQISRFGNLEMSRSIDLGPSAYYRDLKGVLAKYFEGSYKRIEEVARYGPNDETGLALVNSIRIEHGGKAGSFAERYFNLLRGLTAADTGGAAIARGLMAYSTIARLPLAQILNLSQSALTMMRTSTSAFAKGMLDLTKSSSREMNRRSGAYLESTIRETAAAVGGGSGAATTALKWYGFSLTEKINRSLAAQSGKFFAYEMAEKLVKNPKNTFARRALMEMGLDVDGVLKSGGKIADDDLLLVMQRISNDTQYRTSIMELPMWSQSTFGKMLFQFKQFSFNTTRLMKEEWLKQAVRAASDPYEAKRFVNQTVKGLSIMPLFGAVWYGGRQNLRQVVNEQVLVPMFDRMGLDEVAYQSEFFIERPDEKVVEAFVALGFDDGEKWFPYPWKSTTTDDLSTAELAAITFEDAMMVGAFGMAFDSLMGVQMGDRGIIGLLAGPTPRLVMDTMGGAYSVGSAVYNEWGDWEEIYHQTKEHTLRVARRNLPLTAQFMAGPVR